MHEITNMPGRVLNLSFSKKKFHRMKNYAYFNIIIVDFIRIVIVLYKYNTFDFTYSPPKYDFSHILPTCSLFGGISEV
jgi:hypothetical protein